jgi:hypothetical protein
VTEKEWLATDDAGAMYCLVRPRAARYRRSAPLSIMTRRLGSLYAAACIRATPQATEQPLLSETVPVVERMADAGEWDEVEQLAKEAGRLCSEAYHTSGAETVPHLWALVALRLTDSDIDGYAMHVPLFLTQALAGAGNLPVLNETYANLLRDITGNPFRGARGRQFNARKRKPQQEPVFRPEWRTDTVLPLARTMYESRDFTGMPILADALQEAGCEQPDILSHCRDTSVPHARGCWVIDLVLGKQ